MSDILAKADCVLIEQQEECLNCLPIGRLGCLVPAQKFLVYTCDKKGNKGQQIGEWKEENTGAVSKCLTPYCRSHHGMFTTSDNGKIQSEVIVPFKCNLLLPCCSCPVNRPIAEITQLKIESGVGTGNEAREGYGGRTEQGCFCICRGMKKFALNQISVSNQDKNPEYFIVGDYCQKSVLCAPIRSFGCKDIDIEIKDASKRVVGKISFISGGLFTDLCTHNNKIIVDFPEGQDLQKKVRMIHAAMNIKYQNFFG